MLTTAQSLWLWVQPRPDEAMRHVIIKVQRLLCLFLIASGVNAYSSPKVAYILHCGGCHLLDGRGVPPEVPSLRDELGKLVQIPGGRDYIVRVPGASQAPISDEELAEVLNFVLREFNRETLASDFVALTGPEVAESRRNILADPFAYRDELWRRYQP